MLSRAHLFLILAACCVTETAHAQSSDSAPADTRVVCSNARIQSSPVPGGDAKSYLTAGESVSVIGRSGRFYQIVIDGIEGYVDQSFFGSCPNLETEAGQGEALSPTSSSSAAAQRLGFSFGAIGGAHQFEEDFGQEGFIGFSGGLVYPMGLLLLTVDGELDAIFREDPDSPFYFDNSVDRCRDERNGQFATDADCAAAEIGGAVTGDVGLIVPGTRGLAIGAGYRAGTGSAPYGVLHYAFGGFASSAFRLRVQGSSNLLSAALLYDFVR